jgi:Transposase DNA-binding
MVDSEIKVTVEESSNNDKNKWLEDELSRNGLKDARLRKHFKSLLEQLWDGLGQTIPFACQDWANTKAAYRFLSNTRVKEDQILAGHFQSTKERVHAIPDAPILILQDTTEFSYHRDDEDAIGSTRIIPTNKDLFGKPIQHKKCGILMHSSLAITAKGLPLGLTAIKFWTRKQFKGTDALKKHINPTRIPIEKKESYRWLENLKQTTELLQEPSRCVHIGDRESDIYELFCIAKELNTHFLVRTCVDRLIEDGTRTIADEMSVMKPKGLHTIEVQDTDGNKIEVELEIRYQLINVMPPIGKQKRYPGLTLTIIHAEEKETPANRDKIRGFLTKKLGVFYVVFPQPKWSL